MKYSVPKKGHYYTVMKMEVIRPNVAPCLREMPTKLLINKGFRRGQSEAMSLH